MGLDLEKLPDDAESLRAIIAQQAASHQAELTAREKEIEERDAEIKTLSAAAKSKEARIKTMELLVETLRQRIAKLRRQKFGPSSEKIEREILQLELAIEDLNVTLSSESENPPDAAEAPLKKGAGLSSDPSKKRRGLAVHGDIEQRRLVLDPGDECPECGGPLRVIGEDVSQLLDLIAAKIELVETARPKKSCRCCEKITQAPLPSKPIPRSLAGPSLLAFILISKYDDHIPLHRQCEIFERSGVEIPQSTITGWTGQAIRTLQPLAEAIKAYVLSAGRLHTDDTVVPVQDHKNRKGKTKEGRLWVYVRDDAAHGGKDPPAVAYYYSPNRKGVHPQTHLKDFNGILQADAYAGYNALYKPDPITGAIRVREAACWAHLRRDFYDVYKTLSSPVAREALERIGEFYDIEREILGKPPEVRLAVRQKESKPRVDAMKAWFEEQRKDLPPKGDLAKAFDYGLNRWSAFSLFLEDGTVAIDNNAAERKIRPLTLGRRNWLFAGSDAGGENAADIMTLVESAKIAGVNPQTYLADILARINDHKINRISELLPWNWKPLAETAKAA